MSVLSLKRPLTPLLDGSPNDEIPRKRITPESSLILIDLLEAIGPEVIAVFRAAGRLWMLANPIASYSADHFMALNAEPDRCLPAPEFVDAREGDAAFLRVGRALEHLAATTGAATAHVGYNWSPYSWGQGMEEQ